MNHITLINSKLLNSIPGLTHGFTTRALGDMRDIVKREALLEQLNLGNSKLVWAKQVHGRKVHQVKAHDAGQEIIGVDAFILEKAHAGIALGVHVADCVPLLFVDPVTQMIAVAHAGWRGTLAHLARKVIEEMAKLGANPKNILAVIGPHIGENCYDVPEARVELFRKEFNQPIDLIKDEKHYLNLSLPNYLDLIDAGLEASHIEISKNCTHCDLRLFSYRRDTKETFGEMLGFITYGN